MLWVLIRIALVKIILKLSSNTDLSVLLSCPDLSFWHQALLSGTRQPAYFSKLHWAGAMVLIFRIGLSGLWPIFCLLVAQVYQIFGLHAPSFSHHNIKADFSNFSNEPRHKKTCFMPYVNNNGTDQHPRSLIIPILAISEISSL